MPSPRPALAFLLIARRVLIVLAAAYVLFLVAAFAFQRRFIYFPVRLDPPVGSPPPSRGEIVTFPSGDGTRITGLYVAPPDDSAAVALVLHGNGGNALSWAPILNPYLRRGLGALLLDPRGYGWSEGAPTEEGWHQDTEAALAWLASRGIAAPRIVAVGVSIGAGLATPLAARHPLRGLVLMAAFTSLPDAAAEHYPFVPCRLLLRDRYDNVRAAPRVDCPVLIFHGTEDRLVPVDHAHRLAAAFRERPQLCLALGHGHNDVDSWSGYEQALAGFLDALQ